MDGLVAENRQGTMDTSNWILTNGPPSLGVVFPMMAFWNVAPAVPSAEKVKWEGRGDLSTLIVRAGEFPRA